MKKYRTESAGFQSKDKSGLILIATGVGMNVTGWVLTSQSWAAASPLIGAIALLLC